MLHASPEPLVARYDLAMLDLDGVVYIGDHAVDGAARALDEVRDAGMRLAFITNNAARTPQTVASHLTYLGIDAAPGDVVTSAQAAARVAADRLPEAAAVVCLGGDGLRSALAAVGLRPVGPGDDASAVLTGYGPDVLWRDIMQVAVRIRNGLPWIASNTDHTIPTAAGTAPGHGVLVRMLSDFTGVLPTVAGKPERPLLDETIRRMGSERPLMVGDRLDTDIEGADRAGTDSLLVLTGVTGLAELVAAKPAQRPTYLASGLAGLTRAHAAPERADRGWRVGGWSARVDDGRLVVAGEAAGGGSDDADDAWRAVAAAAWEHLDASGAVADISDLALPSALPSPGRAGR
ncbi:HAD-IIA family hydrolase [Nocardioides sp. YIM 152588]|uniref:HAD-IIA family hydrolase n=1 Tax=Nocardioides sp. YIM 152588 TaxID=3158259 RepID=UPI0032E52720